jgi:hypothetical protein
MSDIVEQLRLDAVKLRNGIETKNVYEQCVVGVCADEMSEAAEEIERLRDEKESLISFCHFVIETGAYEWHEVKQKARRTISSIQEQADDH